MTQGNFSRLLAGICLLTTVGFTSATSTSHTLCKGFLPENNLNIPIQIFSNGGGITEVEFNQVLDRLERLYRGDIERLGDKLVIRRYWSDGTVNASAMRQGKTEVLNMYGGLARHPAITVEGFALVACHEMGHHQGGAPKSAGGWFGNEWATNEGGADYFAALKCLRRFFAEDDNAAIVSKTIIDPVAEAGCVAEFSNVNDQLICMRTSMAGQSVADLFFAVKKETTPARYSTPDRSQVSQTNDDHPATQCRLDTMAAGFMCPVVISDGLSNDDYRSGSCYTPRDAVGYRPRCWFAPN